ncbi:hypothetical protein [Shimia sp. SDUM112013]
MRWMFLAASMAVLAACQSTTNNDWENPNRPGYSNSGMCMGGANCGWGR